MPSQTQCSLHVRTCHCEGCLSQGRGGCGNNALPVMSLAVGLSHTAVYLLYLAAVGVDAPQLSLVAGLSAHGGLVALLTLHALSL